ncbi:MarC family protein [Yoonia sp. BS5-3]|uniref:UPF0056 membrane protein n=1 Tax=Yoonia phaeophyticola TaxID=3137369 RepID=A0ABZ2UYY1_9RHOB
MNSELVSAFGAFFAIMNPFVNLPIFLALTSDFKVSEQRKLAIRVALACLLMSGVILVAGQQIISFFGITIDQFRIAGGIVLAHIAWQMLSGQSIASHHGTDDEKNHMQELTQLAFYPLAFPIIVGPGTIATIIIYTGQSDVLLVGGVVAGIILLLGLVFYFAAFFGKILSDTMRVIMTRLMGMILLAIAVEMVASGAKAVFPGLS